MQSGGIRCGEVGKIKSSNNCFLKDVQELVLCAVNLLKGSVETKTRALALDVSVVALAAKLLSKGARSMYHKRSMIAENVAAISIKKRFGRHDGRFLEP